MPVQPIEYDNASAEVRAVYDDIKATRDVPDVNNFWKYLAHDPRTLRRTWDSIKEVMAEGGALDPLTKELVYIAVSVTNGCEYCIASPPCCTDRTRWRRGATPSTILGSPCAVQGQRRSPSSHPQAAAQGDQLARVRCRLAPARQPDRVVQR